MNILYIRESFELSDYSGGALVARCLCNALARKGHRVFVVAGRSQNTPQREIVDGVEIWRPLVASNRVMGRILFAIRLRPYLDYFIKQHKVDIIYNHAYIPTLPATWVASKYHIPIITAVHFLGGKTWFQLANPFQATLNYLMEMFILRYGRHDAIHSPSQVVAKQAQHHSRVKAITIPNLLDLDEINQVKEHANSEAIRRSLGIKQAEQFLLFVGSLVKVKNVDGLIRVLSDLKANFKLVIVGEGPERPKIEELSKTFGLENRVTLLGQKPHREVLNLMYSCDVFILPSKSEVFPNTVLEALTLGKPVIATNVGGIAEIKSENLYLIEDIEEINSLLEKGIEPKDDNRVLEEYSMDKIIDRFENLFEEMIRA